MLNGATQSVVTTSTALSTQPQTAKGEIHVIHQHQQLMGLEAKPIERSTNCTTAVVHIGLRHEEAQTLITHPCVGRQAMQFGLLPKAESGTL